MAKWVTMYTCIVCGAHKASGEKRNVCPDCVEKQIEKEDQERGKEEQQYNYIAGNFGDGWGDL